MRLVIARTVAMVWYVSNTGLLRRVFAMPARNPMAQALRQPDVWGFFFYDELSAYDGEREVPLKGCFRLSPGYYPGRLLDQDRLFAEYRDHPDLSDAIAVMERSRTHKVIFQGLGRWLPYEHGDVVIPPA
jgi:hypothetical protein